MSQTVKKEPLQLAGVDQQAWLFRIPNNTNDYIEVTNHGCSIRGIYVHNNDGALKNVMPNSPAGGLCPIFSGPLGEVLSRKLWDVADVGDNYVFLSTACAAGEYGPSAFKAGCRIMWVNLNRLVLDLFLTPEHPSAFLLSTQLFVKSTPQEGLQVRSFCPQVALFGSAEAPCAVEDTRYANMVFTAAADMRDTFISTSEDIKPMAELCDTASGMYLSAYTTLSSLRLETDHPGTVRLLQESIPPVHLDAGVSYSARAIYGIDYLRPQPPQEEDSFQPMAAFFAAP